MSFSLKSVLSKKFENFIIAVIIVNAISLGMETSQYLMENFGILIEVCDKIALAIFTFEILVKIYYLKLSYFKNPWNVFDFIVVGISFVPAGAGFSVLRSMRVLRILLLVSSLRRLRILVRALIISLPNIASITLLLLLIYYVSAVIATRIFGPAFPAWFGDLGDSFFTLFQLMTLESWAMGIVRPVCERFPYATFFFVPFVLISAFIIMNLFIAVIINAATESREQEIKKLQEESDEKEEQKQTNELEAINEQLKELNASVAEIKAKLNG